MSKEKTEVKKEVKKDSVKKEQYHLTDAVLNAGYSGKIDGRQFNIGFDLNLKGEKQNSYASVMEETVNPARGGGVLLSLIHISEPTRRTERSRMPSSA